MVVEIIICAAEFTMLFFCYYLVYRVVFNAQFRIKPVLIGTVVVTDCVFSVLMWSVTKKYLPTEELLFFVTITAALVLLADRKKYILLHWHQWFFSYCQIFLYS